jgi:hypothetical protein
MESRTTDCGPVSAQMLEIQHSNLFEVVQDCIIIDHVIYAEFDSRFTVTFIIKSLGLFFLEREQTSKCGKEVFLHI